MSQVKKKCRRESFQLFLHVSKDIRFPSPSFDFIFKKSLIATLFTELYKSWFLGLLNELQKTLRNFSFNFFIEKFFAEYVYMYI